jgi:putative tryptophan/tyrosine transport system substrate-binding protein
VNLRVATEGFDTLSWGDSWNRSGADMRRRDFIALVSGGVAALPLGALAQDKMWRMGFLAHGHERFYSALFEGLRELGYVEGRNLIVERRYAEGRAERFQEFAAEMVRLKVDIIIVVTTPAALAVKKATTTIPVVFPNAINPVETGVVASLAHPGGNVTGGAAQTAILSAKRLEIFKEVVPGLSRGAVLWNAANPALALAWRETQTAARALGVTLQPHEVRDLKDFENVFTMMAEERPDVLLVLQDALTLQHRKEIIAFTIRQRLPGMFVAKEWVEAGGLMSYGESLPDMYHRAAYFVDRILKGAKPSDLPVEQVTKFELVLNLKTAKEIGLSVPPSLLARADDIIE